MKKYEEPLMEVMWYEKEDIVRTSEDEGPVVTPQGAQGAWLG